MDVMDIDIQVI